MWFKKQGEELRRMGFIDDGQRNAVSKRMAGTCKKMKRTYEQITVAEINEQDDYRSRPVKAIIIAVQTVV